MNEFFLDERRLRGERFLSRELKDKDDVHSKLRTISVLAVLLQGPFETGNTILGSENLVELMLDMAKSGDSMQEVRDEN